MNKTQRRAPEWIFLVICAVSAGLGLNALVSVLRLDTVSDAYEQVREQQYAIPIVMGIWRYAVTAPVIEEILFRGIAYRLFTKKIPWQAAAVISALLFAVYHGNIVQGSYAFVMGMLLAYFYHYFDSFAAPVLFHGAANLAVFLISYSPQTIPKAALPFAAVIGMGVACGIIIRFQKSEKNQG